MTINTHQTLHFIRHFFAAKRNGHGIHSPFAYRLCEDVFYNSDSFYDLEALQAAREALLRQQQEISMEDLGAGSKTFSGRKRKIKDIAAKGISSRKQSELLYKLGNFLKCNNSIELGTSIGLNTLYLAKSNSSGTITSIEGSSALVNFAKALAQKNNCHNIRFIHGNFDVELPKLLQHSAPIDLLYADGNHTYDATLRYFHLALPHKHNNSVFVFDDIYWSKGMTKAWNDIKQHPEVTLSIDMFYFGLVFFRNEVREKIDLKLFI